MTDLRTRLDPATRPRRSESDAANELRVGILWALMPDITEVARRQVLGPPKPVLDHFPHDMGIVGRADTACWSCRRQAPAERRRTDRHDEQPILAANLPPRRAEKIDVDAVRQTTGPHLDA